jgi:hypothetical protein
MAVSLFSNALLLAFAARCTALNFTTCCGGQIFTPGFAVVDAPQPGTPLGGGTFLWFREPGNWDGRLAEAANDSPLDTIEVQLDVTANGRLAMPPYADESPSKIHNITIFLYSYDTGRNFTITNGTATANNASLGDILLSEPGSFVKYLKWTWPDCLVGNGQPTTTDSDRGVYNVCLYRKIAHLCTQTNAISRSPSTKTFALTVLTITPSSTCPSQSPTVSRLTLPGRPATRWITRYLHQRR